MIGFAYKVFRFKNLYTRPPTLIFYHSFVTSATFTESSAPSKRLRKTIFTQDLRTSVDVIPENFLYQISKQRAAAPYTSPLSLQQASTPRMPPAAAGSHHRCKRLLTHTPMPPHPPPPQQGQEKSSAREDYTLSTGHVSGW